MGQLQGSGLYLFCGVVWCLTEKDKSVIGLHVFAAVGSDQTSQPLHAFIIISLPPHKWISLSYR